MCYEACVCCQRLGNGREDGAEAGAELLHPHVHGHAPRIALIQLQQALHSWCWCHQWLCCSLRLHGHTWLQLIFNLAFSCTAFTWYKGWPKSWGAAAAGTTAGARPQNQIGMHGVSASADSAPLVLLPPMAVLPLAPATKKETSSLLSHWAFPETRDSGAKMV